MNAQAAAGIGHNQPPEEDKLMIEALEKDHDDILSTYQLNMARAEETEPVVVDDETAGKIGDVKKKLKNSMTMLDAARKAEKAPYMAKAGIVQAFFASRIEKAQNLWEKLDAPHAQYLKAKEDKARRDREEKARKDKEEADRKLKEAEDKARIAREEKEAAEKEAERIRQQAEKDRQEREAEAERVRKAAEEEAARVKKAAEEEADRKRLEAAEEKRKADEKIASLEAEKKKLEDEAEENRKKREREIEAEKKKLERAAEEIQKKAEKEAASAKRQAEKEADEKLTQGNREARAIEREGRAEERAAEAQISELNKEVREFEREGEKALDDAVRADRVATKSDKAAMEKGSVLSRTRGETSLGSVTERWVGVPRSREDLLQSAAIIWEHIPFSALEQAVQSAVTAGARDIPGTIITQETKTVNR